MADIGKLNLKLTADPTSFETHLKHAAGAAQRFGDKMTGMGEKAVNALRAIEANPIGAAIAAIVIAYQALQKATNFAAETLHALNEEGEKSAELQKSLSVRFGLTAEAAGGLVLATKKLGLDTERTAEAISHMQRRIGDAAVSGGASAAAFARLGLSAKALAKLPVADQLGAVNDALHKIPEGGARSVAAYSALGRQAGALMPLLREGNKGLAEAVEQSKRWGLSMSAGELTAMENAAIAQRQATVAVGSIRQSIANGVALAWAPLKKGFADAITGAVEFLEPLVAGVRQWIGTAGGYVKDVVDGIKRGFAEWLDPLKDAWVELQQQWTLLTQALGLTGNWRDTMRAIGRVVGGMVATALRIAMQLIRAGIEVTMFWLDIFQRVGMAIKDFVLNNLDFIAQRLADILDIAAKLPDSLGGNTFAAAAAAARDFQNQVGGIGGAALAGFSDFGKFFVAAEATEEEGLGAEPGGLGGKATRNTGPKALAANSREALEVIGRTMTGASDIPKKQLDAALGIRTDIKELAGAIKASRPPAPKVVHL